MLTSKSALAGDLVSNWQSRTRVWPFGGSTRRLEPERGHIELQAATNEWPERLALHMKWPRQRRERRTTITDVGFDR